MNNVFLLVAAASVLLGTLYPLVPDALGAGKISVGPPYFNSIFIPLTLPLTILIGVGALMRWKEDSAERLTKMLLIPLVASLVGGFALTVLLAPSFNRGAALGLAGVHPYGPRWFAGGNGQALLPTQAQGTDGGG